MCYIVDTKKDNIDNFKNLIKNEFKIHYKNRFSIDRFKEKIDFRNKLIDYEYFIIYKINNSLKCERIYTKNYKSFFLNYNYYELIYIFKIKKVEDCKNILFYLRCFKLISTLNISKNITIVIFSFLTFILSLFYIIYMSYFINILDLLGVLPNDLGIDFQQFLVYIFSDLVINYYMLIIGILALFCVFAYMIGIAFVYFINLIILFFFSKKIISGDSFYKHLYTALFLNLSLYFINIFFIFVLLFNPLMAILKIKYPNNKSIDLYNTDFFYGDYQNFTSKFSLIEIDDKYYFSIGNDNVFLYYYDLEKNKDNFLLQELISLTTDKNIKLEGCTQILLNINLVNQEFEKDKNKLKNRFLSSTEEEKNLNNYLERVSNGEIKAILLSNQIVNTQFLQKKLISKIKSYKQKEINWKNDLYVEEIINTCKRLDSINPTENQIENIKLLSDFKYNDDSREKLLEILIQIISSNQTLLSFPISKLHWQ